MRGRIASKGMAGIFVVALLAAAATLGGATLGSGSPRASASPPAAAPAATPERAPAAQDVDATLCCYSELTQHLVERTPLPGGGWQIVIEATLDSNAVCHVFLLQCVVEPELSPANLTLTDVECLSPAWNQIQITLPFVGTVVDVCARFDRHSAGHDQKFRFTYTTPLNSGTVTETAKFFRFPEEYFFVRAQDTITVDLSPAAVIVQDCPDLAEIGASITCHTTVTVEPATTVPDASVELSSAPAQLTVTSLTPDASPGSWDCATLPTCTYTAGGGTLPPGTYEFTSTATVAGPAGDVDDCAVVRTLATPVAQDCDPVTVFEVQDTFVELSKVSTTFDAKPGARIAWTVTLTNSGPVAAENIRLSEAPPALVDGATIRFVSGTGAWTCTSTATLLECTTTDASMPVGEATFEVVGTISPTAPPGAAIVNEIEADYDNNPYGPEEPVRAGDIVEVAGIAVARPTFAG